MFEKFSKIPRLNREMIITEKIDGTNAQVCIQQYDQYSPDNEFVLAVNDGLVMLAGSRKRWITPEDDNFGFARWVTEHQIELWGLGEGRHFGEWYGQGIQRNYGLNHKRWALFNTHRWGTHKGHLLESRVELAPDCCHVVPVLWRGPFNTSYVDTTLECLQTSGSQAAPGFKKPEGIIVFHTAANAMFKVTLEGDGGKHG